MTITVVMISKSNILPIYHYGDVGNMLINCHVHAGHNFMINQTIAATQLASYIILVHACTIQLAT